MNGNAPDATRIRMENYIPFSAVEASHLTDTIRGVQSRKPIELSLTKTGALITL